MKDWRAIALAAGMDLPAREMDRVATSLDALEATFGPLAARLTPEVEPAFCFECEESE